MTLLIEGLRLDEDYHRQIYKMSEDQKIGIEAWQRMQRVRDAIAVLIECRATHDIWGKYIK